ncbi:hypothetical protein J3A64_004770 [Pseudarthrobacter sp. PvP004]|uniref:DUF4839 domain-containing protein n=1 Tax=Pseudarthrobacter sp. PvP004 TaxID=2817850 RepID=UPI001AE84CC2|nr:DUF4839 domain-containing protein [Pseudarthrobacter sp. PvP004]MBP2269230.1 hypothetical protein [Pseudarthrobacter sp. PvP004]
MSDDIKYEYRSVQAVRGMESRSIAKAQREGGWELCDQTQGTIRTTLKFRRVKPETSLSRAWRVFRGLSPVKQRVVGAGLTVLVVLAAVGIGTSAAQEKSGESAAVNKNSVQSPAPTVSEETEHAITSEGSANKSTESAAVNEKPAPSPTPAVAEEPEQVITVENNPEFAALLAATDYCDPSMAQFAGKYKGRDIAFDGSITNMKRHENYTTRYDILVGPGNAGPKTTAGPAFKYEDVNMFDLKLTGSSTPSYVGEGDAFLFTAEVGEFKPNQGCLFFLTPISTAVR